MNDAILNFFDLIDECKKNKISPTLRFERIKLLSDQPERLNPGDAVKSGCDSLNSMETWRG